MENNYWNAEDLKILNSTMWRLGYFRLHMPRYVKTTPDEYGYFRLHMPRYVKTTPNETFSPHVQAQQ